MALSFSLQLAWSQVSVFDAGLSDPFNDWTERHVSQGFTWRPGSVSFRTHDNEGYCQITVDMVSGLVLEKDAERAILVPFTTWGGLIEISTIAQSEFVDVPAGRYALLYQSGTRDGQQWVKFSFQESPFMPVQPVILRGDSGIDSTLPLLMEAEPAA
jgi:Competence protein J (ComJ)